MDNIERALKKYRKGEITLGRAAEITNLDLRTLITIAAQKGIPLQYSQKELKEDFLAANKK